MDLVVAIMAGGAGTRFWPASTSARPKQFLKLAGDRTLLQQSFDRARALTSVDKILVVTNAAFSALVAEQLPELTPANIVGEPERKDTAAACVLATLLAEKRWPGSTLAILTSDHVIGPVDEFAACIRSAAAAADAGALYTVGIAPSFPATGFGYLELGAEVPAPGGQPPPSTLHYDVARFVEKPDLARAEQYIAGGRHLWNAGMFVWRASVALAEMRLHLPAHVDALSGAVDGTATLPTAFAAVPKISIDFGLMEKAARVRTVKATFSWSDVGSFPALSEHLAHDAAKNASAGARVVAHDAHGNVVWSDDDGELVALVGVDDLVVVRAGKRTLVARKSRAEEIKKLVDTLPPKDK